MSKITIDSAVLEQALKKLHMLLLPVPAKETTALMIAKYVSEQATEICGMLTEALAQPQQEPVAIHQEIVELTDGRGNQISLIQAIDHAIRAADSTGAGRLRSILLAAKQALAQPQQCPVDVNVSLEWTAQSPPNNECHYNHTKAETPFGCFLLTWKSWKDYPDYGFDETPWGEVEYHGWNTVEDAQEWAKQEMGRRINACFKANAEIVRLDAAGGQSEQMES